MVLGPLLRRRDNEFLAGGDKIPPDEARPIQRLTADQHQPRGRFAGNPRRGSRRQHRHGERLHGPTSDFIRRVESVERALASGGISSEPFSPSTISTYTVAELVATGDSTPHARPTSNRSFARSRSNDGITEAAVWAKIGARSSCARGSPTQSCSPWVRRGWLASATGVRSECAIPRPAVIQLIAPGSIVCTVPRLSQCTMLPSSRYVTVDRPM